MYIHFIIYINRERYTHECHVPVIGADMTLSSPPPPGANKNKNNKHETPNKSILRGDQGLWSNFWLVGRKQTNLKQLLRIVKSNPTLAKTLLFNRD